MQLRGQVRATLSLLFQLTRCNTLYDIDISRSSNARFLRYMVRLTPPMTLSAPGLQAPPAGVSAVIEKVEAEPLETIDRALEGFSWEFERVRRALLSSRDLSYAVVVFAVLFHRELSAIYVRVWVRLTSCCRMSHPFCPHSGRLLSLDQAL